jgi:SAM-dependent methyltransferase
MGQEIDLLANYPRAKRDVKQRGEQKTEKVRRVARQFGKEFFDGDRLYGYGGFHYNSRFWEPVVPTFQKFYGLGPDSTILDVGCAKGFMMHDFTRLIPGLNIQGVDVSEYAIEKGMEGMQSHMQVADARDLPFDDGSFDLVISINTVHNLEQDELVKALREMMRVSNQNAFVTVDAYRNKDEQQAMQAWNLTAKTILHVDDWKVLFESCGYTGDYYWFMP